MDARSARDLAGSVPVARLATLSPGGRPHVVPVTFAFAGDTLVTAVDRKPKRTARLRRLDNVRAHPLVAVLFDHYADDWTALWWVRADGRARVAASGRALDEALAALVARHAQYRAAPTTGPAIVVTVERWSGWSAA